jgi:hypothetical protein
MCISMTALYGVSSGISVSFFAALDLAEYASYYLRE